MMIIEVPDLLTITTYCQLRTFIPGDPCASIAILAVHNFPAGSYLNRYGRNGFRNGRYVFFAY